ncbi:hypothetical protein MAH1_11540 [Sessilibacter sp. MAH1]
MKKYLFVFLIILVPTAFADVCTGLPDRVHLAANGGVSLISQEIYESSKGKQICSVRETWKGVAPEVCNGWYSLILTTLAQKQPLKIQYLNDVQCVNVLDWADAESPHALITN